MVRPRSKRATQSITKSIFLLKYTIFWQGSPSTDIWRKRLSSPKKGIQFSACLLVSKTSTNRTRRDVYATTSHFNQRSLWESKTTSNPPHCAYYSNWYRKFRAFVDENVLFVSLQTWYIDWEESDSSIGKTRVINAIRWLSAFGTETDWGVVRYRRVSSSSWTTKKSCPDHCFVVQFLNESFSRYDASASPTIGYGGRILMPDVVRFYERFLEFELDSSEKIRKFWKRVSAIYWFIYRFEAVICIFYESRNSNVFMWRSIKMERNKKYNSHPRLGVSTEICISRNYCWEKIASNCWFSRTFCIYMNNKKIHQK